MTQPQLSPRTLATIGAVDRLAVAISRHWLLLAALFLLVFSGLPFVAPILMEYGYTLPAQIIYTVYSFTCHQLAYRSFFLYGAQSSYTVTQLQNLLHVTNSNLDVWFWRDVKGNAELGYKMAYCERDVAMYSSMFLASVAFAFVRKRLKPLNWRWYVALAIVPMLLDGGTQLIMLRESDPLLRVITGVLFGVLSVWLIYPYVEDAMRETYAQTSQQLSRVNERLSGLKSE